MSKRFQAAMWMTRENTSASCGAEAASSCSDRRDARKSCPALTLILDTMVMVSIFAILALILGSVALLALGLILAVIPLIIGARLGRMDAPERQPLLT